MNIYFYKTFDKVNFKNEIHANFADLKAYLDIFVERLNDENMALNEPYKYQCNNLEQAKYICEVCNIELKTGTIKGKI